MVTCFKIKHAGVDFDIIDDWLDVYAAAKKVILADRPLTGLTTQAYWRTLEGLQGHNVCPD